MAKTTRPTSAPSAVKAYLACAIAMTSLVFLSGCNTPTKAVEGVKPTASPVLPKPTLSNVKIKPSKISTKGTNIRAIVNDDIITNKDVAKRIAFLKLRRSKGDLKKIALEELVDQKIKMQEATKRNKRANDAQVNAAFKNFASGNKLKPAQLTTVLNQNRITDTHFKEYIRSQISWNRTVGSKFQFDVRNKARKNSLNEIRKSGGKKPETNEYILQQVIFVIQNSKRKAILKRRKQEAEAFRLQFRSCSTTKAAAAGQLDVTVRALPRVLEPQLPGEWSKAVISAPIGGTTEILETPKGVEFLAICSKTVTSDDNVAHIISQSNEFKGFDEKGEVIGQEFLAELKSKANIIYR